MLILGSFNLHELMELDQLSLSLSSNATFHEFDLNINAYEPKEAAGSSQVMNNYHQSLCLELGSQPCFFTSTCDDSTASSNNNQNEKPSFSAGGRMPSKFLHLLWKNQPSDEEEKEEDEDGCQDDDDGDGPFNKIEEDSDDGVVGWPPIIYGRKKVVNVGGVEDDRRTVDNWGGNCHGRPSNYVKVKMDGVAISRKVNLGLYTSVQALKHTLHGMFGLCQENSTTYKLTYQDKEGDWQLADDVSWRSFILSVRRLKLTKNNNGCFN